MVKNQLKSVKTSISDLEDKISDPAFMWIIEGRYGLAECSTFLHCVFSYVSSKCLPERMHNHTGCICLTFLHCVYSNVYLNCWEKRTHSHTGYTCSTFLHCVFSDVSLNRLPEQMRNHIGYICLTFFHWVF